MSPPVSPLCNSLTVGVYATTVLFSNHTSHVAQPRAFSVASDVIAGSILHEWFYRFRPGGGKLQPYRPKLLRLTNLSAAMLNLGYPEYFLVADRLAGGRARWLAAPKPLARLPLSSAAYTLPPGSIGRACW